MSEENIEVLRRLAETFNTEGAEAAARKFFADDVEFHEPPEQPAPRIARGRKEALKLFQAFDEAWEQHRSEPQEFHPVATDKVLVFSVEHFVGRDGIEMSTPAAGLFTFRQGKIVLWEAFWERKRALEAAGLSE